MTICRIPLQVMTCSEPLGAEQRVDQVHATPTATTREITYSMIVLPMALQTVASFDKGPTGHEEQNGKQHKEQIQHVDHLWRCAAAPPCGPVGQHTRQASPPGAPEAAPGANDQHVDSGLQRELKALFPAAGQHHLRPHRQRAVAGKIHEALHQVRVCSSGATEGSG